ncbi:MAG TPA: hypothetical protein VGQ42_16150 [Candidatus Dormibacteraeota bacterium]|jgi:hypothetical protein|nr:hypothetical protein [Candidatus Dormibacteraeota bacterium]
MHEDASLSCLAVEARWHSIAAAVLLPTVLAGWVVAAVILFATVEIALAAALRVHSVPGRRTTVRRASFSGLAAAPLRRRFL